MKSTICKNCYYFKKTFSILGRCTNTATPYHAEGKRLTENDSCNFYLPKRLNTLAKQ